MRPVLRLLLFLLLLASAWTADGPSPLELEDGTSRIDLALKAFKQRQAEDGSWREVEPVAGGHHLTAPVAMIFLGAGYDHRMPSKYKLAMKAAINRLVTDAAADGSLDPDPLWHALHLAALAEALQMSNDPALRPLVERGAALATRRMLALPDGAGAWAAADRPGVADVEITLIHLMALRPAVESGVADEALCRPALAFVDAMLAAQEAAKPEASAPLSFPARVRLEAGRLIPEGDARALGLTLAALAGTDPASLRYQRLARGTGDALGRLVGERPLDTWVWYIAGRGILRAGDPVWHEWHGPILSRITDDQIVAPDAPDRGLWPADEHPRFGLGGGQLASSIWAVSFLELYYRYLPVKPVWK